jgi:hypothetical protein
MRCFHSYAAVSLLCGLVWLTVSSVAKTADVTSSDGFARLTECALPNNADGIEQDDPLWRRIRNAALREHISFMRTVRSTRLKQHSAGTATAATIAAARSWLRAQLVRSSSFLTTRSISSYWPSPACSKTIFPV